MINSLDIALLRRLLADELSVEESAELEARLECEPELLNLLERLSRPTASELPVLAEAKQAGSTPPEVRTLIHDLQTRDSRHGNHAGVGDWKTLLQDPAPGDGPEVIGRIADFPILGHIATGGMAQVFRAVDTRLDREIALKILSPVLANDPTTRRRFLREARAAARLEHENVLPIHQVVDGELPCFTMRYLPGGSLQDQLDQGRRFSSGELKIIALKVARALEAAHREGIIHRDIKPANILLGQDLSSLMVCDFGIAISIEDPGLTHPGSIVGTPHYMSPEQAAGVLLDGRSDLFSLGAVLFHCATGRPPFDGETSTSVLRQLLSDDPARLSASRDSLPAWFRNLLLRLLAKKPAQRVPDAATLVEILESERRLSPPRAVPGGRRLAWLAVACVAIAGTLYVIHRSQAPTAPDAAQIIADRNSRQLAEGDDLVRQARGALADRQPARALDLIDEALALVPDHPEARYARTFVLATAAFARPLPSPTLDFPATQIALHPEGLRATGDGRAEAIIPLTPRALSHPADEVVIQTDPQGLLRLTSRSTGEALLSPIDPGADVAAPSVFSPDAGVVAALSIEGNVRLWDVAALRPPYDTATLDPAAAWFCFEHHSDTLWIMDRRAWLHQWSPSRAPFRISRMKGFEEDFFEQFEVRGLADHLWTFWQGGNQRGMAGNPMQALTAMTSIEAHTRRHGTSLMISTMARDRDVLVIADSAGAIGIRNPRGTYDFLPGSRPPVTRIALSARGTIGAALLENGDIFTFSPSRQVEHHRWPGNRPLRSLAFLDGGETLLAAGRDGGIDFLHPLTGEALRPSMPLPARGLEISAVPHRDEFLTRSDGDRLIKRWSATQGELLHAGMEHEHGPLWFSPSLDGHFVFSIDQEKEQPESGALRIWSLRTGEEIVPALEHDSPLNCATIYGNGTRIATATADGKVRRWTPNPALAHPAADD